MENRRAAHGVLFNDKTTVYNPNKKFFVQKLRSTKQGLDKARDAWPNKRFVIQICSSVSGPNRGFYMLKNLSPTFYSLANQRDYLQSKVKTFWASGQYRLDIIFILYSRLYTDTVRNGLEHMYSLLTRYIPERFRGKPLDPTVKEELGKVS